MKERSALKNWLDKAWKQGDEKVGVEFFKLKAPSLDTALSPNFGIVTTDGENLQGNKIKSPWINLVILKT